MELFQQGRPLWGSEGHRHRGGLWLLGPVPQGADQDVDLLEFLVLQQATSSRTNKGTQTRFRFFIETPLVNTACIFYRKYFCLDCLRCDLVVSTGEIRR